MEPRAQNHPQHLLYQRFASAGTTIQQHVPVGLVVQMTFRIVTDNVLAD